MISVVAAIYNVQNYVRKCIESIICQSYTDIEIILVDDGSTDDSGRICDEYAKIDERIKVIHKANGGLSDARNRGIDVAKGKQIMFVDGDDFVHPQMLEVLHYNLVTNNADISTCEFKPTKENQNVSYISNVIKGQEIRTLSREEALGNLDIVHVMAWGKLYRATLFDKIRYPIGKYHEDEFVIHRLIYESQTIVTTDAKLYYYVQRPGAITAEFSWKKIQDAMEAYNDRIAFVKEKNMEGVRISVYLVYIKYLFLLAEANRRELTKEQYKIIKRELREKIRGVGVDNVEKMIRIYSFSSFLYHTYIVLSKIKTVLRLNNAKFT